MSPKPEKKNPETNPETVKPDDDMPSIANMLESANWEERLEQARRLRQQALAEKGSGPATPSNVPVAPLFVPGEHIPSVEEILETPNLNDRFELARLRHDKVLEIDDKAAGSARARGGERTSSRRKTVLFALAGATDVKPPPAAKRKAKKADKQRGPAPVAPAVAGNPFSEVVAPAAVEAAPAVAPARKKRWLVPVLGVAGLAAVAAVLGLSSGDDTTQGQPTDVAAVSVPEATGGEAAAPVSGGEDLAVAAGEAAVTGGETLAEFNATFNGAQNVASEISAGLVAPPESVAPESPGRIEVAAPRSLAVPKAPIAAPRGEGVVSLPGPVLPAAPALAAFSLPANALQVASLAAVRAEGEATSGVRAPVSFSPVRIAQPGPVALPAVGAEDRVAGPGALPARSAAIAAPRLPAPPVPGAAGQAVAGHIEAAPRLVMASLVPKVAEPVDPAVVPDAPAPLAEAEAGAARVLPAYAGYAVHVNVPSSVADEKLASMMTALGKTGFPVGDAKKVGFKVSRTNVRYFYAQDGEAAKLLAEAVGGIARDFTGFSPRPPEKTIEIWLSGTPARTASRGTARPRTPAPRDAELLNLRNSLIQRLQSGDFLPSGN